MTQYEEWPDQDKQALAKRVADELQDDSVTRRELLTMLGVVGVGSAVGGAGVNSAVGTASAGTAQSGTIGTATNPVDLEGEDINAAAVNTDELSVGSAAVQAALDGLLVPVGPGLGVADAIDPSTTTTPVQDAINAVSTAGGGEVLLPSTPSSNITDTGPLSMATGVSLRGVGLQPTAIEITGSTNDGFRFDTAGVNGISIENVRLVGPGDTTATGIPIHYTARAFDVWMDNVHVSGWSNDGYRIESGVSPSNLHHGFLRFSSVDAGDDTAVVALVDGGPHVTFDHLNISPSPATSASDSIACEFTNSSTHVGTINVGGSVGPVINSGGNAYSIGRIDYEPDNQQAAAVYLVKMFGTGVQRVDSITAKTGALDDVYRLGGSPARKMMGPVNVRGSATLTNSIVNVASDPFAESWYFGASGDIRVTHGGTTEGEVRSLASAGVGNG